MAVCSACANSPIQIWVVSAHEDLTESVDLDSTADPIPSDSTPGSFPHAEIEAGGTNCRLLAPLDTDIEDIARQCAQLTPEAASKQPFGVVFTSITSTYEATTD
ncbi:hypothetical protein PoB_002390400 [Plakobranchus ocellatus]|uniref:Uncharacterized protein n=1 Tax=Plakobranchus ocellatus TaxID=259542 RepID=A0AAV3ZSM0_9GAST|nr:hypothetical protein PoB_002390400 [Plakobranchus ocellatus]